MADGVTQIHFIVSDGEYDDMVERKAELGEELPGDGPATWRQIALVDIVGRDPGEV